MIDYEMYKLIESNRKEVEENDDPDYQQYIAICTKRRKA